MSVVSTAHIAFDTLNSLAGLFLLVVLIYFVEHIVYAIGVFRGARSPEPEPSPSGRGQGEGSLPLCTILVCARDEENNIEQCLASLDAIDYPKERLEVLI